MIALTVHILCNIAFITMTMTCHSVVLLTGRVGYDLMGVEDNSKMLDSFIGSTHGIAIQVCRLYGASLRLAMGRVNMMVQVLASNVHLGVINCELAVSVFEMHSRW